MTFDSAMAVRHITALHGDGPFELRLMTRGAPRIGYFDCVDTAVAKLQQVHQHMSGCYMTLNPVDVALLNRSYNDMGVAKRGTTDADVTARNWLPIDIDYVRPTGISTTDYEREQCHKLARKIMADMDLSGWPAPIYSCSGNGAHLLYPLDLPNDLLTKHRVSDVLAGLAKKYNDGSVLIDQGVGNAARIWKICGTTARKGSSTEARPHRMATLLECPELSGVVTLEQLDAVALPASYRISKKDRNTPDAAYQSVNEAAFRRLDDWVPYFFPPAIQQDDKSYRIPANTLQGKDGRQDIKVAEDYIVDYSLLVNPETPHTLTPVQLVARYCTHLNIRIAADVLAAHLKVSASGWTEELKAPVKATSFAMAHIQSGADLQRKSIKPLKYTVKGFLPTGAFLLASRPKMGKSFLALQLALSVVTGTPFIGFQTEKGKVLYLGLEDNERRIKERMELMYDVLTPPDLSGFFYFVPQTMDAVFPKGVDGCSVISAFLDAHPETRLIVIDTLFHFRSHEGRGNVYAQDYEAIAPIQALASSRDVTVLLVTHYRKGTADKNADIGDYTENVTGSSAVSGAVDGTLQIEGKRAVDDELDPRWLMLTGRDVVKDLKIAIDFDANRGGWVLAPVADLKSSLLTLIADAGPLTKREICKMLPAVSDDRIERALIELRADAEIRTCPGGYKVAPESK